MDPVVHPPHTHDDTTTFAREFARRLKGERPDVVVDSTREPSRETKVLVDWLQNRPRRSIIAPYSLRAADWPTVSTPVGWEEVERAAERGEPLVFTAADIPLRLERLGDLFASALEREQRLPGALLLLREGVRWVRERVLPEGPGFRQRLLPDMAE